MSISFKFVCQFWFSSLFDRLIDGWIDCVRNEETNRSQTIVVGEDEVPLFGVVELEVLFLICRMNVKDGHEGAEEDIDVIEGLLDALLVCRGGRRKARRGRGGMAETLEDGSSLLKGGGLCLFTRCCVALSQRNRRKDVFSRAFRLDFCLWACCCL